MSDTPYMEMQMAVGELWWLDPFHPRHKRKKKRMHAVTLRLTDDQLAAYKALGGALGIRKLLESNGAALSVSQGTGSKEGRNSNG